MKELGFDACVDYKAGELNDDLKAAVPERHRLLLRERRRRDPRRGAAPHERLLAHRGLRPDLAVQRDRALRREDLPVDPDQPHQGAGLHRLRPHGALAEGARRSGGLGRPPAGSSTARPSPRGWRMRPRRSSACSKARTSASSLSGSDDAVGFGPRLGAFALDAHARLRHRRGRWWRRPGAPAPSSSSSSRRRSSRSSAGTATARRRARSPSRRGSSTRARAAGRASAASRRAMLRTSFPTLPFFLGFAWIAIDRRKQALARQDRGNPSHLRRVIDDDD